MAEYLLVVVEGLAADGADVALLVSKDTYHAVEHGGVFDQPYHAYGWCGEHGWVMPDYCRACEEGK